MPVVNRIKSAFFFFFRVEVMLCRPFIGIYWHINFFPCNKPVKMEMCVYVSIAVTALDSAFLHVPSPRKALLDINFILNKPHHALPNEYEITKAWSKRRNINCSQLLIGHSHAVPSVYFPIPDCITPTYPLRLSSNISFSVMPTLISVKLLKSW